MTPSRDPLSLLLAALRAAGNLCEKAKHEAAARLHGKGPLHAASAAAAIGAAGYAYPEIAK